MFKPTRMCAVCRARKPKDELIRIARATDGNYVVDDAHSIDGRGAYVCKDPHCIELCVKKRMLNRSFKDDLPEDVYEAVARKCPKN